MMSGQKTDLTGYDGSSRREFCQSGEDACSGRCCAGSGRCPGRQDKGLRAFAEGTTTRLGRRRAWVYKGSDPGDQKGKSRPCASGNVNSDIRAALHTTTRGA